MSLFQSLFVAFALPFAATADTVLGVYIFSREGDRTAQSTPPSILTELGYSEVYQSGNWFRDEYIANGASKRVWNLQPDKVQLSQISASAPSDNVLMSSAMGFLQGLYPPIGNQAATAGLRNGSTVTEPLNGYQLIPVQLSTTGSSPQSSAWLQGSSGCGNAIDSFNNYFNSSEYYALSNSTQGFYQGIAPVVANTFPNPSVVNFYNAYTIYDLINVAEIHNSSFPDSNLINSNTFNQLRTLADQHEFGLAYNATDPIRAIAGATLAGQVVQALNATINSGGTSNLLNVQFGNYNTFLSFFGLTNLTSLPGNGNFMGLPDYASTITFELYTHSAPSPFPPLQNLNVRFYFHNGTTNDGSTPQQYPLFSSSSLDMPWTDFANNMNKFAVNDQQTWCTICGNSSGLCQITPAQSSGHSVSPAVGGIIGAIVTIAILSAVAVGLMLCLGLRCMRRGRRMGPNGVRHEKGVVKT